jgi:hypothetical protein
LTTLIASNLKVTHEKREFEEKHRLNKCHDTMSSIPYPTFRQEERVRDVKKVPKFSFSGLT